jgi:hypothetical protein
MNQLSEGFLHGPARRTPKGSEEAPRTARDNGSGADLIRETG